MVKYRIRFAIVSALLTVLSASWAVSAETWHLEQGRDWKAISAKGKDKYLSAVAQAKKLVNTGQAEAARKALNKLKKDFPEIAGPDLDAFIEAEMLFCEGKFTRAVAGFDKLLAEYPESALFEAALDRQFAIATAFLAGRKKPVLGVFKMKGYAEGEKIMERISDRAGNTPIGTKAATPVAGSFEKRRKFNEAYHKWSQILSRWPTGQIGKDALLAMARCKHAAYRGPKYDVSNLISAKSYYENFRLRYPEDAEEIGVDKILKQVNELLAYKQLDIGRYYQGTGNEQSANLYYRMVVDNWPGSKAAKMAKKMMNKNLGSEKTRK